MDRTPTRPAAGAAPDLSCYSSGTIVAIERWLRETFPLPPARTMDAVCDEIESLCLAASLGVLPASGVAWVRSVPWATIDYLAVDGRVEVVAVSSLPC